ncbi:hypothetical protein D3C78_1407570 [compost metagenome]
MIRLKDLSDSELLDKYTETKLLIEGIERHLRTIDNRDEVYIEEEDEMDDHKDYLNELAHEMIGRLIERR